MIRRAEDATRAGTWISLRRTVALVAFASFEVWGVAPEARVAAARERFERDDREHEPGGVER